MPPDILQTPAKPKQDAAQKTANAAQEPDAALFKAGLYTIENLDKQDIKSLIKYSWANNLALRLAVAFKLYTGERRRHFY